MKQNESIGATIPLPRTYEELLSSSPQASIFATRWWLNAVAPGSFKILEVRNGAGILAAWPIVFLERYGIIHFVMPALTQKLGILFNPSSAKLVETQSTYQSLSEQLIDQLGPHGSFHHNFHETFTDWLPFHWNGFSQTTRYTYVIDDLSSVDAMWDGMRSPQRRSIKKAEKQGLTIRDDLSLDEFLELNRKTFTRQGKQPLASDELIRRVDAACLANAGRSILSGVDSQGRVHAAVYIAWFGNTAFYLMGGSEPELRDSGAQLLAMWEALKMARSLVKRFDFEGSMLPQVERVFRGFGAKQIPYSSIFNSPPPPSSLKSYLKQSVQFRLTRLKWRLLNRTNLA